NGNTVRIEGEGYFSACMQHETDHLDGKLFIDHISYLKRSMYDKKMKKAR
ncbi:MAG: peptide deformylase, partial [Mailhella sp.]|nr:peptide deformylase [Mailhella sp.]